MRWESSQTKQHWFNTCESRYGVISGKIHVLKINNFGTRWELVIDNPETNIF